MFEKLRGRTPGFLDLDDRKQYAVIAPFLPEREALLLEVRSSRLNRQPGEICFPGGRLEPGETPLEAALRETAEELLIDRGQIEVVAPLDRLLSLDRSLVSPFLALLHGYEGTCNRDEVEEVFTVPFRFFVDNPPKVYHNRILNRPEEPEEMRRLLGVEDYPWRTGRHPVLFYQYENRVIWGMTARFICNLVELWQA